MDFSMLGESGLGRECLGTGLAFVCGLFFTKDQSPQWSADDSLGLANKTLPKEPEIAHTLKLGPFFKL